jgi:pimeloyl-ACP methyl ester carboxylesterase
VPALVMTGEFDAGCGPALNAQMAKRCRAPAKILPDLKHSILVEDPSQLASALAFLLSSETGDHRPISAVMAEY